MTKSFPATIAILTDSSDSFRPNTYEQQSLDTFLKYSFKIYKVKDQSVEVLQDSANPFAIVIRIVLLWIRKSYGNDTELMDLKSELARDLFNGGFPVYVVRKIFYFLTYYVSFEDKQLNVEFEKVLQETYAETLNNMGIVEMIDRLQAGEYLPEIIDPYVERGKWEGRVEGRAEGRLEGKAEGRVEGKTIGKKLGVKEEGNIVIRNLATRFSFTAEEISEIVEIDINYVKEMVDILKN